LLLNICERPSGDAGAGLRAQLLHGGMAHAARARRGGTGGSIGLRRAGLAPEHAVEEVVIGVVPIAVVIAAGPERIVENVGVGVGPEHRSVPAHESGAPAVPPGAVCGKSGAADIGAVSRRKARSEAAVARR